MALEEIGQNLTEVRARIAAACAKAGRDPAGVRLVAVTKTVGLAEIAELARLGVRDFGENRVPDGLPKTAHFASDGFTWHFIGHLQRNKAGAALEGFRTIHSLESVRLAEVLQREVQKREIARVRVLLEVNISGEESKYGVRPQEARALADYVLAQERLELCGLMTMAPFCDDAELARPVFAQLRELREELRAHTGLPLPELSMGMSGDYTVAVEEGATLVRVGSALFARA